MVEQLPARVQGLLSSDTSNHGSCLALPAVAGVAAPSHPGTSLSPPGSSPILPLDVVLEHRPRGGGGGWIEVAENQCLRMTAGKGKRVRLRCAVASVKPQAGLSKSTKAELSPIQEESRFAAASNISVFGAAVETGILLPATCVVPEKAEFSLLDTQPQLVVDFKILAPPVKSMVIVLLLTDPNGAFVAQGLSVPVACSHSGTARTASTAANASSDNPAGGKGKPRAAKKPRVKYEEQDQATVDKSPPVVDGRGETSSASPVLGMPTLEPILEGIDAPDSLSSTARPGSSPLLEGSDYPFLPSDSLSPTAGLESPQLFFDDEQQFSMAPVSPVAPQTVTEGDLIVNGYAQAHAYFQFSDSRLKTNIEDIDDAMSTISRLSGKTFRWRSDFSNVAGAPLSATQRSLATDPQGQEEAPNEHENPTRLESEGLGPHARRVVGLIAQEVREVLPEVVNVDAETGIMSVSYAEILPVLIEAHKELARRWHTDRDHLRRRVVRLEQMLCVSKSAVSSWTELGSLAESYSADSMDDSELGSEEPAEVRVADLVRRVMRQRHPISTRKYRRHGKKDTRQKARLARKPDSLTEASRAMTTPAAFAITRMLDERDVRQDRRLNRSLGGVLVMAWGVALVIFGSNSLVLRAAVPGTPEGWGILGLGCVILGVPLIFGGLVLFATRSRGTRIR